MGSGYQLCNTRQQDSIGNHFSWPISIAASIKISLEFRYNGVIV